MKTVAIAVMIGYIVAAAAAQDKPSAPKGLTVGDVIGIVVALNDFEKADQSGKPIHDFKFSGMTRLNIARDIAVGTEVMKSYQEALVGFRIQIAGSGHDVPKDKIDDFNEESVKMLKAPAGVELARIKQADLCLDAAPPACPQRNEIPVSDLSALLPILDQ